MGQQLYQRLPQAFVEETLEAFNDHRMTERQACALLELKRARLYELRREWLRERATWVLAAPRRTRRRWSTEITTWLHRECQYLQDEAVHYRGRFNFAVLAEGAHQRFGRLLSRSGVRRWAIRQGYYQQTGREVRKVYIRWESAGPGVLWHHDTSHHCWVPHRGGFQDLILTQDDYSRRIVGVAAGGARTAVGPSLPGPGDDGAVGAPARLLRGRARVLPVCGPRECLAAGAAADR